MRHRPIRRAAPARRCSACARPRRSGAAPDRSARRLLRPCTPHLRRDRCQCCARHHRPRDSARSVAIASPAAGVCARAAARGFPAAVAVRHRHDAGAIRPRLAPTRPERAPAASGTLRSGSCPRAGRRYVGGSRFGGAALGGDGGAGGVGRPALARRPADELPAAPAGASGRSPRALARSSDRHDASRRAVRWALSARGAAGGLPGAGRGSMPPSRATRARWLMLAARRFRA